ncbi:MAG: hypothetical protein OXI05_08205 [Bacteroidota bacterium]|nr:hypothetical protein [Bacteroidota bacterium]
MWIYRRTPAVGFVLAVINHVSSFVLSGTSEWLIDEVIHRHLG